MNASVRASVRAEVKIPLIFPDGFETSATMLSFRDLADEKEHVALRFGTLVPGQVPLVRVHSECLTGDVFGSARCDCGPQLRESIERISKEGGYVLYLRQEGRGIGLYAKLDAYRLQDEGLDTFEANRALGRDDDERQYTVAAQMLNALGECTISLLSNNPDKFEQMSELGINIVERIPTAVHATESNYEYLAAKVEHHAHTIDLPAPPAK